MVPVSASEMSISVVSIDNTRSDSSRQSDRASRCLRRIVGGERGFRGDAQARHRRAQVVRHVIEGVAHAMDQRGDAREHRVEQACSTRRRHRRCRRPARDRRSGRCCRIRRTASRRSRSGFSVERVRNSPPTIPIDQRGAGAEHQHAPEIREQLIARFGGLADLQRGAAADVDGRDFEHGVAIARAHLRPDGVGPAGKLGRGRTRPRSPAASRTARPRTGRPAARTAARGCRSAARARSPAPARAGRRPGSASRTRAASTGSRRDRAVRAASPAGRRSGRRSPACWRERCRGTTRPA